MQSIRSALCLRHHCPVLWRSGIPPSLALGRSGIDVVHEPGHGVSTHQLRRHRLHLYQIQESL